MGMSLRHVDRDKQLEMKNGNLIFLNDLDPIEDEYLIRQLTLTVYNDSSFSLVPRCNCGQTTKETHPHKKLGDVCDYCLTEIQVPYNRRLSSSVWVRVPDGVTSFIEISFLSMLLKIYKYRSHQGTIIHWLLDPWYRIPVPENQTAFMLSRGVKRGINYFVENADYVMELLNDPDVFSYNDNDRTLLRLVYEQNKHLFFPKHLPLTDKSFNVVEHGHLGSYVDSQSFNPYMDVINTITSLKRLKTKPSVAKKEHVTSKILFGLVAYYEHYIKTFHNDKFGEYRKQVYGSRLPFTSRQVVVSIVDEHDYDEMHMPWGAMIPLLEYHITNRLIDRGKTPNQIKGQLYRAINNYDEELAEIMDDLIAESPHRTKLSGKPGLMFVHNRNPSLKMGSLQQVLVTKIKKDPTDISKAVSVLTEKVMNLDHDGDETNEIMAIDLFQSASFERLNSAGTVLSLSEVNKLSGDVNLPKQIWTMYANWAEEGAI